MLVPALFGSLVFLKGRGRVLGHIAAVLGVLGLSTLPGLVITDRDQLAMAQTLPLDQAVAP